MNQNSFFLALAFSIIATCVNAQDVNEQKLDGYIIDSNGNDEVLTESNWPVGIETELTGKEADLAILRNIASNQSADVEVLGYQITDKVSISRDSFAQGTILLNKDSGIFSVLGERLPFTGQLQLSDEQIIKINALQNQLFEKIRNTSQDKDSKQVIATISRETQALESQVLDVLLPHQRSELRQLIIRKLGIPGSNYFGHLIFKNRRTSERDQKKAQIVATEELKEISSTVGSLKKRVYRSLTHHLSSSEKLELEKLVGQNLEDWFMIIPLEKLVKQLQFIERGAVPRGRTMSELVDEIHGLNDQ